MAVFGAQWCGTGDPDCLPVLRWASDAGTLNNRTDGFIQQVTSIFSSIPPTRHCANLYRAVS